MIKLKCRECGDKFNWDAANNRWPSHCPFCNYDLSLPPGDEPAMPFIRTNYATKNTDAVYRQMEEGSIVRAQAAADMLGVPVSEVSDLKITDMNDRRDSEVAARTVVNDVSIRMAEMEKRGMPVGFGATAGAGVGFSSAVNGGVFANSGAHMQTAIRTRHGTVGHPVGDLPANEIFAPGYVPRVRQ